jgi:hypothetical protein
MRGRDASLNTSVPQAATSLSLIPRDRSDMVSAQHEAP